MKIYQLVLLIVWGPSLHGEAKNKYGSDAIHISYSNDFFTGSDQYYTQGIHIEFYSPLFRKFPASFLHFLPDKNALTYHSFGIQQDGFTPSSISVRAIQFGDRPYCGSLFFTNTTVSLSTSNKTKYQTQLYVGAIGQLALGFEEQTAIHKGIHDDLPQGWKHQIQNDLILNYNLSIQKSLIDCKLVSLSALSQLRLGSLYTDLSVGTQLNVGRMGKWYKNIDADKAHKMQLYAFGKWSEKAVAYNATMQGGWFNKTSDYTISTDKINRMVGLMEVGVVSAYKKYKVEYTQTYISKEFKHGDKHAWGTIKLMIAL